MSSPFQARFQTAESTSSGSSSSPAYSSRSLSSMSSKPHPQASPRPVPEFKLHPLLQTSQGVVADNISSYLLWDVRARVSTAQYVQQLGTFLSPETSNSYATDPPVSSLKIKCSILTNWELTVRAPGFPAPTGIGGGARARNSYPVWPSPVQPTAIPGHIRSSSESPRRPTQSVIPSTPAMRSIPLPLSPATASAMNPIATMPTQVQATQRLGITISDVLTALYNDLRTPIDRSEVESLPEKKRKRVIAAFQNRIGMAESLETGSPTSAAASNFPFGIPPTPASVMSASASTAAATEMMRVDTLMRYTWFAGLEVVTDEEWTVNLSLKIPTKN